MNRVFGIIAYLIPRIYSLNSTDSERSSFLDIIFVSVSMAALLALDNTRLMITFHSIMIVMHILSYINQNTEWLFVNMLPIYISFVLIENTLILIPKGILVSVTLMAKYGYNGTLTQYDYSSLGMELIIYLIPFLIVGYLTSKKSPKKENYYIHYFGLLAMSFLLVSGNGFDYLFDNDSIISSFIPTLYSFILKVLGFIPIGKILCQLADFGMIVLERSLSSGNNFVIFASSIHSFVRPILGSINASMLFQWLGIFFIQYVGCFFLGYAYDHGPVHEKIIRLFIPTYGRKSSGFSIRYV